MNSAFLTFAPVILPLSLAVISLLLPRGRAILGVMGSALLLTAVGFALASVVTEGRLMHQLGAWPQGLAITLRIDAFAALFLLLTAIVVFAVSIYASAYFSKDKAQTFWPLWWLLVTSLNALFTSHDLFNLYVALELLGLSAVALVALAGTGHSLKVAIRYLGVGLLASLLYLLAVALLYFAYGSLDIEILRGLMQESNSHQIAWVGAIALVLISVALMFKSALFPLHFWLPDTHANAPAPVSAVLSALVIKAAWYMVARLWLDLYPGAQLDMLLVGVGSLGAIAVLWGSWNALRAPRLKLLAAWSSVAQIGYLFLSLSLLLSLPDGDGKNVLLGAIVVFALSHGFAKAGLFLAAGVVQQRLGHDRIEELDGIAQRLPATAFAIAIAGVALVGLPPSGAFLGKWIMLDAAFASNNALVVVVVFVGSLLAGAYVFRVISHMFGHDVEAAGKKFNVAAEEWPALSLALIATLLLGFASGPIWRWLA